MFNFQGSLLSLVLLFWSTITFCFRFRLPSIKPFRFCFVHVLHVLCYYITWFRSCQVLFWSFLNFFCFFLPQSFLLLFHSSFLPLLSSRLTHFTTFFLSCQVLFRFFFIFFCVLSIILLKLMLWRQLWKIKKASPVNN